MKMLDTFPKSFSPRGNFPSGNYPLRNFPISHSVLDAALHYGSKCKKTGRKEFSKVYLTAFHYLNLISMSVEK